MEIRSVSQTTGFDTRPALLTTCSGSAVAGSNGEWMVRLGALAAGGPYTLTAADGAGHLVQAKNVLVGEVYMVRICMSSSGTGSAVLGRLW